MAKDKKDEREDMPVEGSETFIPYEDEPRAEEGRGGLAEGATVPAVGLTYAEERRLEEPVPPVSLGETHVLSTMPRPENPEEVEPNSAADLALRAREYRRARNRAVAVHHQLGELARGQGHYPGEILPLHTEAGMKALLGGPGVAEALESGAVNFEANVIRAIPQGMASRVDPNEE